MLKYPNSEEPEQSVSPEIIPRYITLPLILIGHGGASKSTNLPIFKALATQPQRAMVFAGAMKWHAMLPGFSHHYLVDSFPWKADGSEQTIVDVGGSLGHVSFALAAHGPNVKCIVEDFPDVAAQGEKDVPEPLRERVTFRTHDFFQTQPVEGADVY